MSREKLDAFFKKLETPFVPTKEDLEVLGHVKKVDKKAGTAMVELMNLTTLAELLGAKMDVLQMSKFLKQKIETRLSKRNRSVSVVLTPEKTFVVTYFENGTMIGESEEHLGFRRIANWLE